MEYTKEELLLNAEIAETNARSAKLAGEWEAARRLTEKAKQMRKQAAMLALEESRQEMGTFNRLFEGFPNR